MGVFDGGPARDVARVAGAHPDDGQFTVERDEAFEDEWDATERGPCGVGVAGRAEHRLALAVVAAAPGFQHCRKPKRDDCRLERRAIVDRAKRRGRDAERPECLLFDETILGHFERPRRRQDGHVLRQRAGGAGRHAFPLVGDDLRTGRGLCRGGEIVEFADHEVSDCGGGRVG